MLPTDRDGRTTQARKERANVPLVFDILLAEDTNQTPFLIVGTDEHIARVHQQEYEIVFDGPLVAKNRKPANNIGWRTHP